MPIKNRGFLAWTVKVKTKTPQRKVTGRPPCDTLEPRWPFPEGIRRQCFCAELVTAPGWPRGPCRLLPSLCALCPVSDTECPPPANLPGPQHRRPHVLPAVLCSRCAWEFSCDSPCRRLGTRGLFPGTSRVPVVPHVLIRGVFTVLEAAVLYQNRKGKATTFLFRFFPSDM